MSTNPLQTARSFLEAFRLYSSNPNETAPSDMPTEGLSLNDYLDSELVQNFEAQMGTNPQLRGEWLQAKAALAHLQDTVGKLGTDPDPNTISASEMRLLSPESQSDVLLALGVLHMYAETVEQGTRIQMPAVRGNFYRDDPMNFVISRPDNTEPVAVTVRFEGGGPQHSMSLTLQPGENPVSFLERRQARDLMIQLGRRQWTGNIEVVDEEGTVMASVQVTLRGRASGGPPQRPASPSF